MVRLVFRPYTQIRRTICTSVSLRASTRVSSGFTLPRHSSPSFGSRQVCSTQTLHRRSRSVGVGAPFTFIAHAGLPPEYSHTCQTPWSVFLDGSGVPIPSDGAPAARPRKGSRSRTKRHLSQPTRRLICNVKMHCAIRPRRLAVVEKALAQLSRRCEAGHIRVSSCQFQALFNSLFKVLCIFPSRYLFAIGLPPVFSFRWNLPPTSSCNPKQPDSTRTHRADATCHGTGFSPSPIPSSKGFERQARPMATL